MALWIGTAVVFTALAVASMFKMRFAYIAFIALGVLWMPARAGFHLAPRSCEIAMSLGLALHSLTNYKHIVLFTAFAAMTLVQFAPDDKSRLFKLGLIALGMTIAVEVEQALLGVGHCRVRDLLPNAAGTLVGACLVEGHRAIRARGVRD